MEICKVRIIGTKITLPKTIQKTFKTQKKKYSFNRAIDWILLVGKHNEINIQKIIIEFGEE